MTVVSYTIAIPSSFEEIVSRHYAPLYRFALSLARTEADACDLTQQTFYIFATKGHQLRDFTRIRSWLFTILHREFLNIRNKAVHFPHFELSDETEDLPSISPDIVNTLDAARVLEFLGQVQEPYRAALSLYYLEDYSYQEIADILEVPLGTVRSRISRGLAQLQRSILIGTEVIRAPAVPDSKPTGSSREISEHDRAMGPHLTLVGPSCPLTLEVFSPPILELGLHQPG
jgi:RNA polymerase sigma-70 factor (ECF subfamily)